MQVEGLRINRTLLVASLAAALVASGVGAQGVPVFDSNSFAERLGVFLNLEQDHNTQVEKAQKRADMQSFEQQQIATLDSMIEAFSSVSTFQTSFVNGTDSLPGTQEVYGPLANPAAGIIFGDARENIEQLIIRGSQDTYGHPGVAAAGLTPLQWRCLLQALIWQESRFQVGAKSPANAFGLTQIIPGTAKGLGIFPAYYDDPYLQVTGGGRYLADQLKRFDGNIVHALAAYNAGPGAVIKYKGVPPYKETQGYVQLIPNRYNQYLARIGGVEALGTIDPALYAAAEASLLSSGSMYFAEHSMLTAQSALRRVRALVQRIGDSPDVKASYDLNTAIRAEIIFILNERLKLKAGRTKALTARQLAIIARQNRALAFLDFTPPTLP